ncbi:MAG: zinc-binding dehydrogenase [Calditrichia bacterium]
MKAVVLHETGDVKHLKVEEIDYPKPVAGEVTIKIRAAALNHRDLWIVQGKYAKIQLPAVLGSDGTGTVHEVGEGVDRAWLNREVVINPTLDWGNNPRFQQKTFQILGMPRRGTLAEYVAVPVTNVHPKPSHLSFEEAAAIPLGGVTGYRALFTRGQLKAGETCLITGIGGGVSSLIMQMALAAGANVLVTSGSGGKIERAVEMGVLGGANYTQEGWPQKLQALAGSRGIDLVVDSAVGPGFPELIELVNYGGRIVVYGVTSGNPGGLNFRRIFWKQINLLGTTMGTSLDFENMIRLFESKNLHPFIDEVFLFENHRQAFQRMLDGKQAGKIVLKWSR